MPPAAVEVASVPELLSVWALEKSQELAHSRQLLRETPAALLRPLVTAWLSVAAAWLPVIPARPTWPSVAAAWLQVILEDGLAFPTSLVLALSVSVLPMTLDTEAISQGRNSSHCFAAHSPWGRVLDTALALHMKARWTPLGATSALLARCFAGARKSPEAVLMLGHHQRAQHAGASTTPGVPARRQHATPPHLPLVAPGQARAARGKKATNQLHLKCPKVDQACTQYQDVSLRLVMPLPVELLGALRPGHQLQVRFPFAAD
mmetsp:Transcript_118232/g.205365  ORF Transcript_118232/g.205365 Transcript_118232/m.205365 type:complete len:262 (-) Transcript_118232:256-1041(-)